MLWQLGEQLGCRKPPFCVCVSSAKIRQLKQAFFCFTATSHTWAYGRSEADICSNTRGHRGSVGTVHSRTTHWHNTSVHMKLFWCVCTSDRYNSRSTSFFYNFPATAVLGVNLHEWYNSQVWSQYIGCSVFLASGVFQVGAKITSWRSVWNPRRRVELILFSTAEMKLIISLKRAHTSDRSCWVLNRWRGHETAATRRLHIHTHKNFKVTH